MRVSAIACACFVVCMVWYDMDMHGPWDWISYDWCSDRGLFCGSGIMNM